MPDASSRHLFLPSKDRSFWKGEEASDLPLLYLAWGRRDFSQEFLPECMHEGWVCTVIEEGNPVMVIQGQAVTLQPRQMVMIGPDCSFGWPAEKGSTCKFLQWMWRDLSPGFVEGVARDAHLIREWNRDKGAALRENHNRCRREVLALDELSAKALYASRLQLEVLLQRLLEADTQPDLTEIRMMRARTWMEAHLDSREPIARLCDYLDVSQPTLHRLFRSKTGKSPAAYFHAMRMETARSMLAEGQLQVKEVALTLGYRHINDFSRAYKAFFGKTPSQDQP